MLYSQNQFFKGVAITAMQTWQDALPLTFDSDATLLGSVSLCRPVNRNQSDIHAEEDTHLAAAWLSTRMEKRGISAPQPPALLQGGSVNQSFHWLMEARRHNREACQSLGDDSLVRLLDGAQTGLTLLGPARDYQFLVDDTTALIDAFPSVREMYIRNGIPPEAIGEILTYEYAGFRIASPFGAVRGMLSSLALGLGARFGWLEVFTVPFPADVYVDSQLTGKSTLRKATYAGAHQVKGQSGQQKDTQSVTVLPAQVATVSMTLK